NISSVSGKAVLQGLVHSSQEEYNELSKEECKELVHKFEDYKAMQTKVLRVSTKSKINSATHTLAAIENKSMLFAMHGTTDMPMRGAIFSTSGVENFLKGVMRMDTPDFLGKMEGFTVQGIQGIISFF
ncbi:hypothetical protein L208DRAFT_1327947, partial [Tricholoma matsutake]